MGIPLATAPAPRVASTRTGIEPARGGQSWARAPLGTLAAGVGVAVWLLVYPRTPDLAAQVYRATLFRDAGFLMWDSHWYGGHPIPGYSLLFPPLAALLGVRAVGAAAVLASAALFEALVVRAYGPRARWAAVWFALAALGDVWSGRVTFALGASFALGAVVAFSGNRAYAAAVLAALCAACSPVAGVLLALAGLTHALLTRSPRALLALAAPATAVAAGMTALFGEGGWEPFPLLSFLATVAVVLAFLWAVPPGWRALRVGAIVYLAACVACVAVHTPMGANVERYGVLLAGPLLILAVACGGRPSGSTPVWPAAPPSGGGPAWTTALVLAGIAVWTVWGPVRETAAVAGNLSTSPAYYLPVERFLAGVAARTGQPVRVEVPFTRSHWEAAWLAAHVSLARGWEKQLDERYDEVLLAGGLTAAAYRAWLAREAVGYVALPDTPLDPSSAGEGRLIAMGLPYLRLVWRTSHWRIYEVLGATPLARGPGTLRALGHDWFALRARAGGSFIVRVRYTRYFTVTSGAACVREGPGGWTEVSVPRAGAVRVTARFSLARALGLAGASCRDAEVGSRGVRPPSTGVRLR